MSHPLMVEAIEELFVPVIVYNNKPVDAAILKQFGERSWNNPVVRFLDQDGKDLVPKKENIWTIDQVSHRMVNTLTVAGRPVPEYLKLVAESKSKSSQKATFAMHCFWEGEAQFARLDGVQSTLSGWKAGKEVVEVVFDPEKIEYKTLVEKAKSFKCASVVFAHGKQQMAVAKQVVGNRAVDAKDSRSTSPAKTSDRKYYLRKSIYSHLPLSELQAAKINSALRFNTPDKKIGELLSKRQQAMLQKLQKKNKKELSKFHQFVFPESESKLRSYCDRLNKALR